LLYYIFCSFYTVIERLVDATRMQCLRSLVLRLANADRVGGRATVLDNDTLVLNDCMHWGSLCTESVLAQFPEIQISVRSSRQSLSGFSVVFYRPPSRRRELFWCLVIGLALACCAYVLLRPPWWPPNVFRI
jgi:hypothetical protein